MIGKHDLQERLRFAADEPVPPVVERVAELIVARDELEGPGLRVEAEVAALDRAPRRVGLITRPDRPAVTELAGIRMDVAGIIERVHNALKLSGDLYLAKLYGRTAERLALRAWEEIVGRKLKKIAGDRQVVVITHLPQVAAFADAHVRVTKTAERGRTRVTIEMLDEAERTGELARMLGGANPSAEAKAHAAEMLRRSRAPEPARGAREAADVTA